MSTWEEVRKQKGLTFIFWNSIVEYEILVLLVICAQRHHNFTLHVEALERLIPIFFALDHMKYAKWTPSIFMTGSLLI